MDFESQIIFEVFSPKGGKFEVKITEKKFEGRNFQLSFWKFDEMTSEKKKMQEKVIEVKEQQEEAVRAKLENFDKDGFSL